VHHLQVCFVPTQHATKITELSTDHFAKDKEGQSIRDVVLQPVHMHWSEMDGYPAPRRQRVALLMVVDGPVHQSITIGNWAFSPKCALSTQMEALFLEHLCFRPLTWMKHPASSHRIPPGPHQRLVDFEPSNRLSTFLLHYGKALNCLSRVQRP